MQIMHVPAIGDTRAEKRRIGYYDTELYLLWTREHSAVGDPPKKTVENQQPTGSTHTDRRRSSMRPTAPTKERQCNESMKYI